MNLTPTEVAILKETMRGLTSNQIAYKRFRSTHTINAHMVNIKSKLKAKNTPEAIVNYLSNHPSPKELLKSLLIVNAA